METAAWVVRGNRGVAVQRVSRTREEGRVAFDLDQVEVAGRIDHLLEEPAPCYLGVGEAHPMGAHVLRVAADVSDQEQRPPGLHGRTSYSAPIGFQNLGQPTTTPGTFGGRNRLFEFEGDVSRRQIERYGDRWFTSRNDYHSELGPGSLTLPLSELELKTEHEITADDFERAWGEACRQRNEQSGQAPSGTNSRLPSVPDDA